MHAKLLVAVANSQLGEVSNGKIDRAGAQGCRKAPVARNIADDDVGCGRAREREYLRRKPDFTQLRHRYAESAPTVFGSETPSFYEVCFQARECPFDRFGDAARERGRLHPGARPDEQLIAEQRPHLGKSIAQGRLGEVEFAPSL